MELPSLFLVSSWKIMSSLLLRFYRRSNMLYLASLFLLPTMYMSLRPLSSRLLCRKLSLCLPEKTLLFLLWLPCTLDLIWFWSSGINSSFSSWAAALMLRLLTDSSLLSLKAPSQLFLHLYVDALLFSLWPVLRTSTSSSLPSTAVSAGIM